MKTPRGQRPCGSCFAAIQKPGLTKWGSCTIQDKSLIVGSRRSPRDTSGPTREEQIDAEKVKACNLVMDPVTGLRPDGDTCRACWEACYKEDGYNPDRYGKGGTHAVIGPDAPPCSKCIRYPRGSPYAARVAWAHAKLNYLADSKAAGNR